MPHSFVSITRNHNFNKFRYKYNMYVNLTPKVESSHDFVTITRVVFES